MPSRVDKPVSQIRKESIALLKEQIKAIQVSDRGTLDLLNRGALTMDGLVNHARPKFKAVAEKSGSKPSKKAQVEEPLERTDTLVDTVMVEHSEVNSSTSEALPKRAPRPKPKPKVAISTE